MEASITPQRIQDYVEAKDFIAYALPKITYREREILRLYFGIGPEGPMTYSAIGRTFGISRNRVRQIAYRGLYHLRQIAKREAHPRMPGPAEKNL